MAKIVTSRTLTLTTLIRSRSLQSLRLQVTCKYSECAKHLRGPNVTCTASRSFDSLHLIYGLKMRTCLRASSSLQSVTTRPKLEVSSSGRKLSVTWTSEEESVYSSMWLRHNCRCPKCWSTSLNYKTIDGEVLQGQPIITSANISEVCGKDVVNVCWRYEDDDTLQHYGHVQLDWLKENCYSNAEIERVHKDTTPLIATSFQTFRFEDVMKSEEGLWRWLRHVSEYGFAVLTNAPLIEGHIQKLGESFGPLEENYHGVISNLRAVGHEPTTDLSYSQSALPFHIDLCHYEKPPGLQMLYSLRFDDCVEGGETVLVDFYSVACNMREKYPKYFEWLTQIPFNYVRWYGRGSSRLMMEYHAPSIELNQSGEIIALRYHPQSEGPLLASEEDVEKFYEAYSCLWRMINNDAVQFPRRLRPGEVLTFNNRRMIHGRRAMKTNEGTRHLQCCYVTIDDVRSKLRVLASKFAPSNYRIKNMFNSDSQY